MMDLRGQIAVEAAETVRAYLKKEFITDTCRDDPCFGCISCQAVDLDRKLHAFQNMIEDFVLSENEAEE